MSTNRRNFIKKAATGAVGVTFANHFSVNAMSAKSYSNILGGQ